MVRAVATPRDGAPLVDCTDMVLDDVAELLRELVPDTEEPEEDEDEEEPEMGDPDALVEKDLAELKVVSVIVPVFAVALLTLAVDTSVATVVDGLAPLTVDDTAAAVCCTALTLCIEVGAWVTLLADFEPELALLELEPELPEVPTELLDPSLLRTLMLWYEPVKSVHSYSLPGL